MKVVIVHGSNRKDKEKTIKYGLLPQNERGWIGWVKEELTNLEIECVPPLMPENWAPVYEKWKEEFEKINLGEEDILVGASIGGAFLLRYLDEVKKEFKKLILIAPAFLPGEGLDYLKEFMDFELDWSIKERIGKIICFISDNDLPQFKEGGLIVEKELGAELIELSGRGHFTEKGMGTKEFPELLEKILE